MSTGLSILFVRICRKSAGIIPHRKKTAVWNRIGISFHFSEHFSMGLGVDFYGVKSYNRPTFVTRLFVV